ncbi:MAG: cupin domain-containing protein [Acidimicrobiales bacterium]
MGIRRVVTGHDSEGKAVVVDDEELEPDTFTLMPGMENLQLWASDGAQTYPDAGIDPGGATYFPPVGGFRFGVLTVPPESEVPIPDPEALAAGAEEVEAKMPGMMGHMEPDEPGMHTTDTTDFEVVLAGEFVLELDDGVEVVVGPGDVVVQNGTRHRWHNRGDVPATFALFMVGANRS